MVVGVGGIGNFRDLGDPNDPRRGLSTPQPNGAPGLPDPGEYGTQYDLISRGFGAGTGGMYVQPPQGRSGQGRRMIYGENGESIPTSATQYSKTPFFTAYQRASRQPAVVPRWQMQDEKQTVTPDLRSRSRQFVQQGPAQVATDSDKELLREYELAIRESAIQGLMEDKKIDRDKAIAVLREDATRVNERDVVQTLSGERAKGNLTQDDVTPHRRGAFIEPSLAYGKDKNPFYTVDVPLVGRDRQVKKGENRPAVKRIDPRGAYITEEADPDTILNAQHANEAEVTTSNARIADELRQEYRTPLITNDQYQEEIRQGTIRDVSARDRNHVADKFTEDGQRIPVYETKIREDGGVEAPMYRIGRATNVDEDEIRNQLNPRYKTESSAFDTQVVRTGAYVKRDADGNPIPDKRGKLARTEGFAVETGPSTFLNRDDVYPFVPGMRKGIEKDVRKGNLENVDTAIASLDQVLRELAGGQYMTDPDVANGYQRMAIEIEAGRMDPRAVPERARQEVAQYQAVLRASAAPVERVPIQSQPTITEVVLDNPADLVSEEINGPARNFDGDGRVVQGKYGDFSELEDGSVNGVSTFSAPELEEPELAQARRAVDDMLGLSSYRGGLDLDNQAKLDQLSRAVLDDAVASVPAPMVNANNKEFQAALRQSADRLAGNPVRVVQGRSMPIRTPNDQAVVETGTAVPQTQQAGVANTESVSQLNAPAPAGPVGDVDPEVARLLPYVGNGVRDSQIDLISKGLAAEPGSKSREAADQLLSLFRRRLR